MENSLKIKYFFAVAVLVSVICFGIFLSNNSVYRGEAEVLLIARNSIIDEKIDALAQDAQNIPLTLSFYDRLVRSGKIESLVQNLNPGERKDYWQYQITTERISDSHIIKITAYDSNEERAGELADIYARQLTETLAGYYNIRTQLDTRIIDQSITHFDFRRSVWPQAAKSIFWGIVAGMIDILLISVLPQTNLKSNRLNFGRKIFTFHTSTLENQEEPDYFPPAVSKKNEEKRIITPEKKSSAPENLPLASEEEMKIFEQKLYANGKKESSKKEDEALIVDELQKDKPKEDIFREATPEEVKERLNKLLSGKM